jgi:hypothetical protein
MKEVTMNKGVGSLFPIGKSPMMAFQSNLSSSANEKVDLAQLEDQPRAEPTGGRSAPAGGYDGELIWRMIISNPPVHNCL